MTPAPTALVIKERDRTPLPGGGQRLLLEIFAARDTEARVFTWQMDVTIAKDRDAADPASWRVARLDRLSFVSGLFKLGLDVAHQYDVRNLTLKGADLTLQMATGAAFVATTPDGPTAIVLLGQGRLVFSPPDPSERTQIKIFSGSESLAADFDVVLVRIRPSDFATSFPEGTLTPRLVAAADARRAANYFDDYIGRTLNVDLNDLSRERWSLLPQPGDLIAEVRTKRYGTLTYARIQSDAEDVSFFDRRRKKNIAVYASREKLETRGRFYSEDDSIDYDVTSYDTPGRLQPRAAVDRRAGEDVPEDRDAGRHLRHAEDRGFADRAERLRRGTGPPDVSPGRRPERGDHQLPRSSGERHRAQRARGVRRTARAAGARSRSPRPRSGTGTGPASTGAALHLQQSQLLVPAVDRGRLRHRETRDHRARRVRRGRQRHASGSSDARGRSLTAGRTRAQVVRLQLPETAALPRMRDQPFQPRRDDRSRAAIDRRAARDDKRCGRPGAWSARRRRQVGIPAVAGRPGEPAAGVEGPQHRRAIRRHLPVLRVDRRGRPVSELHARVIRKRAARRPQSGLFRHPQSAAPDHALRLAQRSRQLRQLSDLLPRPRARTSMVGSGDRLEELSRAVAQRGNRAVLRRDVRGKGAGQRNVRRRAASDAPLGDRGVPARPGATSDTDSATSKATAAYSAPSSTTKRRW